MAIKKRAIKILKLVASLLMILLTAVSIVAVFWRITAKYVPFINGSSFFWANEFELLVLNWVVVIGMMVVFMMKNDICITMFYDKFKPVVRKNLQRIFDLMHIGVFFVIAVWGMKLAIKEWETPTSTLMWSRGCFVYFPYVILAVFVILFSIYELVNSFRKNSDEEGK